VASVGVDLHTVAAGAVVGVRGYMRDGSGGPCSATGTG
jgi:hypothetical protein